LGTLLTRFENDHLSMQFEAVPKPSAVILYTSRSASTQAETFTWVKEWIAQKGRPGVKKLWAALRKCPPPWGGVFGDLLEIVFESGLLAEGKTKRPKTKKDRTPSAPKRRSASST
jgi:hypothetical protein